MNERPLNYRNMEIRVKNNFVTMNFDCDFGPISFSFSPEKLSAELSKLVSEMLDMIHREEPDTLNTIARDSRLSIPEVKKILESHILNSKITNPWSDIEKVTQGRNFTLEGSVQQIMENLPASIILMLIHLTAATLLTATDVNKEHNSRTLLIDHELGQLIFIKFKDAINKLWERIYENTN